MRYWDELPGGTSIHLVPLKVADVCICSRCHKLAFSPTSLFLKFQFSLVGMCAHLCMSVTGNRCGRCLLEMGITWKFPTLNPASYLFPTLVCQRSPKFSRRRRSWWHTASVSPFPWWRCTCSSSRTHVSPLLNPSMHPRVYQSHAHPSSTWASSLWSPLQLL